MPLDQVKKHGPARRPHHLLRRTAPLAVAVAGTWALTSGSPVGHFRSVEAKDRYLAAYDRAMGDLPTPDATLDIPTSFGTVRVYRFAGAEDSAEPLVLLPGQSSGAPLWGDLLSDLAELRPVYALDLLGHPGRSVQDTPVRNAADQAVWLNEVLQALPNARFHLFGLSIGGWSAMNLAAHEPDAVASLTLIDSPFVFAPMSAEAILRSIPLALPWTPDFVRESFTSWTAGGAPVEDVPVADMIEAGLRGYAGATVSLGRIPEEQVAGVGRPVLVVVGGASPMHDPQAVADGARRLLTDGTVVTYEGASHAVAFEERGRLLRDLGEFLGPLG